MKYYKDKSTSERLVQARETLHNVQEDPELKERLAKTGYTDAEFSEGIARLDAAQGLHIEQEIHLGEQVKSTTELEEIFTSARKRFNLDRRLVRSVVETNTGLFEGLRLHIATKRSRALFIQQASHFYTEVVTRTLLIRMLADAHKITPETFDVGRNELARFIEAINTQQHMIGKAQVATRARSDAMDALDEWMKEFNRTARFTFKGSEGQLKKLGITVRQK